MKPSTVKLGPNMIRRLPPVDIDLEVKTLAPALNRILGLTDYESKVFTVLLSSPRPLIAGEINKLTSVPRTKVYGTLKKLLKAGLVSVIKVDDKLIEKPDVWPWWPQPHKNDYLMDFMCGVDIYAVNREYLEDFYLTWDTETFRTKDQVGRIMDLIKGHADLPQIPLTTYSKEVRKNG